MEEIKEEKTRSAGREVLSFLLTIGGSILFVFLFINFVMRPITVSGNSMHPTLKDGAKGFTNVLSLNTKEVERFDIVVFHSPINPKEYWVKRVIALPEETIYCEDGVIYVNDIPLDESVLQLSQDVVTQDFAKVTVPEDSYFVMGDNRKVSFDSRKKDVGPIEKSSLVGKDVMVLYPFSDFGYEK